ncbi:CBS domain-containing protein, partial [bacterium]|nr:CBS domain-containing protein [bacterium]
GLLKDLLRNVKDSEIHNRPVMLTVVRSLGNVQELLPVMDALWSREEPYLLIAGVCYIGRTYVWARGKMPQEEIFRCFSGYRPIANHRWTVFSMNENEVDQVLNKLLLDLQAGLRPDVTAAEIMMTSPKCVDLRLSVAETLDTMLRFNQMWFVVTKEGEFAGMIRRLDLDRAVQMDIWDSPIGQFISANYPSITVDTPVRVARQLMILHNLDQLPVVDQGRPVGVITTREILRGLPDPIPIPKRFIPLVQTPDLPDCEKMTGLVKRVVSIPVFHILKRIGEIARKNSVQAYLVGGFVRDLLLERLNLDIDIVIIGDALPFAALASQELNAEIRIFDLFHTAQLTKDGIKIDFSSARLEHYSASGALPEVELSGLFNDLSRRDFTMNAMALDLSPDRYLRLVDFFGGYRDILNHRLRILHSFSFIEDPTRIFRAIRFASRFRFGLTEDTASAFHLAVDRRVVEKLSPKRMHAEISRCFREEFPGRVMDQLFRLRLLRAFHQDLTEAKILPPRFKMIPGIVRRFGVIGEPIDSETVHWIGLLMHVSPIEVDGFLKQIGHSSLKRRKIVESIAAMISTPPKLVRLKPDDNVGLSELLSGLSPEGLVALVTFSLDKIGVGRVFDYLARLRNIRSGISGKDLLGLGIPSGPHIGLILKETLREKIRGGLKNRKDELAYAGKLYQDLCLQKFK